MATCTWRGDNCSWSRWHAGHHDCHRLSFLGFGLCAGSYPSWPLGWPYGYYGYAGSPIYGDGLYGPGYFDPIPGWEIPVEPTPTERIPVLPSEATLSIDLPDGDAIVWINGYKTTLTGRTRTFQSPALEPGKRYSYVVTASWNEDGQPFQLQRKVYVSAGQTSVVDMTTAPLVANGLVGSR